MNEDYLWDKSGEPDPQIQELEEILAPLRYQPKPLTIAVPRKRNYFPLLAIAATVLIALLATGLWLRLRTETSAPPQKAKSVPSVFKETPMPEIVKNTELPRKEIVRKRRLNKNFNREEALAAKQQVMLALRLTSQKLKLAQTKIKNQNKIG